jgi:CarboxypepD_reg-like domain
LKQKLLLIISIITFQVGMSQSVEISGIVESNTSLENINIINKTTYSYAITNAKGEFKITAKLNDTLQFSSMLHKTKYVVVDKSNLLLKAIKVNLEDQVNQLREVTVGNTLTGDLLKDVNNVEGNPPINFFDLGIPGYTGKLATQSERRLNEATTGGGFIPLNPILNAISGRTKQLKNQIEIEEAEALIQSIKGKLAKDFFASNPLEEDLRMDFFYFCADDERFIKYCKNETDFKIMTFLRMKYKEYLENLKEGKN